MLLAFTGMIFLLLLMRLDQVGNAFIALLPANHVVGQPLFVLTQALFMFRNGI